MKRLSVLFILLFALTVHAKDFKEGTHYAVLDRQTIPNTVVEVYSVYCNYCFSYELQVVDKLKAALPARVIFDERHVKEKGKYGAVVSKVLAGLGAINRDAYQKAKIAYYTLHFIDGKELESEEEYIALGLKAAGVSHTDYERALNSSTAKETIAKWDEAYNIALFRGTPAILVNNQYVVLMGDIKNQEELNALVLYLLEK